MDSSGVTEDTAWVLQEAMKPCGFIPHALSVAEFAKSLETRGWLLQHETFPSWGITERGRAELARLSSA